jgi:hypothetical protein
VHAARLRYSKKGWTDSEIGVEYIKDFHEQTKEKAKGQTRLLLVDGHNIHYSLVFLEFACAHCIHILCYPAHGSHVYQGLDVVIFGPLKLYRTQEKDAWLCKTGQKVDKTNFLQIYGAAHIRALTPMNIKAAFRKTGVQPFNHGIVTPAMMAPSLETSCCGHLPVTPATPVCVVTDLIRQISQHTQTLQGTDSTDMDVDTPLATPATPSHPPHSNPNSFETPIREALNTLQQLSRAFLITSSPIQSSSHLPVFTLEPILPQRSKHVALINGVPTTVYELELQEALHEMTELNT